MRTLLIALLVISSVRGVAAPFMYIHDSRGFLGLLDVGSGEASIIGDMGVDLTDIAFDGSGRLFGISFTTLYRLNPETAEVSRIGDHGIPNANALVFTSGGQLLAAGATTQKLYRLNFGTGASTELGDIGFSSAGDLAFSGGRLFLSSKSDELIEITLSPTVSGNAVGRFGFPDVFGLATGPDQTLLGFLGIAYWKLTLPTDRHL